jgi:hypothetical protein
VFAEVEQVAFSPANVVPGIGFSPDRMLQARLFSYGDAQRYRLGVNFNQIPVNQPRCPFHSYHRDGAMVAQLDKGKPLVVGRTAPADVEIPDPGLSRRHASIMYLREDRAFYLLDLNSLNGSYVNGVRVDQQRLKDGDFVRIGNTEFFFFISEHYENLEPLHADVHAKLLSALLRENTIIE